MVRENWRILFYGVYIEAHDLGTAVSELEDLLRERERERAEAFH